MRQVREVIFQPSDLANRRVEVLEAARAGAARVRDKDGTALVMLPEEQLRSMEELMEGAGVLLRLEHLLASRVRPSVRDLGNLAWLRNLSDEDLREFVAELHDALVSGLADGDPGLLQGCLHAWRVTARQMDDPLRRNVLQGSAADLDLAEAARPE